MGPEARLSDDQVTMLLEDLEGWTYSNNHLRRRFDFRDFNAAFGFMTRSAMVCEQLNHHPNWYNVYNRVEVHLVTHDSGGITQLDIDLAVQMNRFAVQMNRFAAQMNGSPRR